MIKKGWGFIAGGSLVALCLVLSIVYLVAYSLSLLDIVIGAFLIVVYILWLIAWMIEGKKI